MQGRVLREQFGAHWPARGREKAREFRSPDWHEGMRGYWKDGLPLLYFSFCREKRVLFFFFPRGDSKEAFLGYCFQESVGSVLEATLGILISEPLTGSACPGLALTRSSLQHPCSLSPGPAASRPTPVSWRPQAPRPPSSVPPFPP